MIALLGLRTSERVEMHERGAAAAHARRVAARVPAVLAEEAKDAQAPVGVAAYGHRNERLLEDVDALCSRCKLTASSLPGYGSVEHRSCARQIQAKHMQLACVQPLQYRSQGCDSACGFRKRACGKNRSAAQDRAASTCVQDATPSNAAPAPALRFASLQ